MAPRSLVGRIVKEEILAGKPVLEESLVPPDRAPLFSEVVPPGYRAIGVMVDGHGDSDRLMRSRDRVDVVVTMEDENGVPSSKILLQDVEILSMPDQSSVGQAVRPGANSDHLPVTLAVTPAEGEKLSLAMHIGTIQLLVRGHDDADTARTSGVTKDTLLPHDGASSANAQGEPATTYRTVEIIKGQERHRERFRETSRNTGGTS